VLLHLGKYLIIVVIKWKAKKYHSVGTIQKSNIKIVERCKIDTTNTLIHDVHFPDLVGEVMSYLINRIVGVMVSALASGAVDREFEPRSGQTKDYKFCICCFSAKHAALRRKSKD
jgi:hypothetical protein